MKNEKISCGDSLKSLETTFTNKFQKLKEEKNDEITRQLKKSIDLIDENELLENQLEKLYLLIEEKNIQINHFEENELKFQNEIKRIKIELNSADIIGYQYKIHNTDEKASECQIIRKKYS